MPPPRRTVGLAIMAGLLIVAGGLGGCGAVFSIVAGGSPIDRVGRQLNVQLDAAHQRAGSDAEVVARVAKVRTVLNERLAEVREVMESPAVRLGVGLQGVLAVVMLVGGIGLLRLRAWARPLLTGQALGAIAFGLWWLLASPASSVQRILNQMVFQLGGEVLPSEIHLDIQRRMEASQQVGIWIGAAALIGWNLWVLWFVNRSRTVAQLENGRSRA